MRNFIICTIIVRVIKARGLRWAGHVARMEEGRSTFKIVTGKPSGKRSLGRLRCRWEDNIKETYQFEEWVDSAHDSVYWKVRVNATSKLNIP